MIFFIRNYEVDSTEIIVHELTWISLYKNNSRSRRGKQVSSFLTLPIGSFVLKRMKSIRKEGTALSSYFFDEIFRLHGIKVLIWRKILLNVSTNFVIKFV